MSENKLAVESLSMPETTYTVPEDSRQLQTDPKKLTIRLWSTGQEMDALRAAGGSNLNYEILQRSVIAIDDSPVDQGSDFMGKWSPKMRQLAAEAINRLSLPTDKERSDFFASAVTKVR